MYKLSEEYIIKQTCFHITIKSFYILLTFIPFYFICDPQTVNSLAPFWLGGICLFTLFSLRKVGLSQVILMPLAWFLLACITYYGAGPLIYIFGNQEAIANIDAFYYVDQVALWRTNLLNIVSITLIVCFFSLGINFSFLRVFKKKGDIFTLKKLANIFTIIGALFTLLTFSLRSGLGQGFTMPGIFFVFAKLLLSGIFLYSLLYFTGLRKVKIPLLLAIGFAGFFAITSLMKQNILELFMVIFFGAFLAGPSAKKLLIAICGVLIILPTLTTLVSYARIMTWTEDSSQTSVAALVTAMSDTDKLSNFKESNENSQGFWGRICYAPAQAFAMDAYDRGKRGETFETALWAFVPRLIYPDKPVITHGEVFTTLVKGAPIGGGSGAGYFGEAYWNMGWFGVFFMSMVVGILLAALTQFNIDMVSTGNYQFYPVAWMAITVGYRVDDWFVATTVNSIPIMIVLYIMIKYISKGRNLSSARVVTID